VSDQDQTMRIERVELAEHYYAVAGHMRGEIARMNEVIDMLTRIGDRICEESARKQVPVLHTAHTEAKP
jgi:hypothetical protein